MLTVAAQRAVKKSVANHRPLRGRALRGRVRAGTSREGVQPPGCGVTYGDGNPLRWARGRKGWRVEIQ